MSSLTDTTRDWMSMCVLFFLCCNSLQYFQSFLFCISKHLFIFCCGLSKSYFFYKLFVLEWWRHSPWWLASLMQGLFLGDGCLCWQRSKTEEGRPTARWINRQDHDTRFYSFHRSLLIDLGIYHEQHPRKIGNKLNGSFFVFLYLFREWGTTVLTFPFRAMSKTSWKQQASSWAFLFFFFGKGAGVGGLQGEQHSRVLGEGDKQLPY